LIMYIYVFDVVDFDRIDDLWINIL
jgi:hypothetical protein